MSRLTENAVMVDANGRLCFVQITTKASEDPNAPVNNKKKTRRIYPIDDPTATVEKAEPFNITSADTMVAFIGAFNKLPAKERSGYDSYVNAFGPTNPESPREIPTQGLLKIIGVYTTVLHERHAKGGHDGEQAKIALDILAAYNAVAQTTILKAQRDELLAKYASLFDADEVAAERARLGLSIPAATVDVSEADETAETPVTEEAEVTA